MEKIWWHGTEEEKANILKEAVGDGGEQAEEEAKEDKAKLDEAIKRKRKSC